MPTIQEELISLEGTLGFTEDGGIYQWFRNKTGIHSIKGCIVTISSLEPNSIEIASPNSIPLGVIYDSDIPNGSLVRVVTLGKAKVLLKNGLSSTSGSWCGISDISGTLYTSNSIPTITSDRERQIGFTLSNNLAGINILTLVNLKFN